MIYPIVIYGNPTLRKPSANIDASYPNFQKLVEDMWITLGEASGVGLAAPQIGRDIKMAVISLDSLKDEFPEYENFNRVYINPEIVEYDESKMESMEEGCLSLPGIHEPVKRPTRIHVKYMDENFTEHDEWVDGFLARVMQHEFDHLDGTLFIDRLATLRKQMIRSKLTALAKGKVKCNYKIK